MFIKKFLSVIITVLLFFPMNAISQDIDELLNEAYRYANEESINDVYDLAIGFFLDGLYFDAVEKGNKFLKQYYRQDIKRDTIVEMLAYAYYKQEDYKNLKKLWDRYNKTLGWDAKIRVFQLLNNYLIEKLRYKEARNLRRKYKYLFKQPPNFEILNPQLKMFKPNINIFQLKEEVYIGENVLYVAKRKTNLYQVAKDLDMGFDEMKLANPTVNPLIILKGMVIFVPRRRLLPKVDFEVGTIYLNLGEKRLYYPVKDDNDNILVISIPIGIGTDENQSPIGEFRISEKRKNPSWYVPESIRKENPDLPKVFPPGPDNPLGTRAMRLGRTSFLMHGTSKRFGIGMRVSHGCIRMYNKDVEKLFEIVKIGTKVISVENNYKNFIRGNIGLLEVHGERKHKNGLSDEDTRFLKVYFNSGGIDVSDKLLEYIGSYRRAFLNMIDLPKN